MSISNNSATPPGLSQLPELDSGLLYFLWLLRRDVTTGWATGDPRSLPRFLTWWVLYGRQEYPLAGDLLSAEHYSWLLEAETTILQDTFVPLTRLMLQIWHFRADLQVEFSLESHESKTRFASWFFIHAINEYKLYDFISKQQYHMLSKPDAELADGFAPLHPSSLLVWLWHPAIQKNYPIDTVEARGRYLDWYEVNYAPQKGLSSLRATDTTLPATPRLSAAAIRPDIRPFGVNLIGFARGEFGIGEDVRMAARACEVSNIPFGIFDIPTPSSHRGADRRVAHWTSDKLSFFFNIFCMTGFDSAGVHLRCGPQTFSTHYNIGYWPWELSEWPDAWVPAFSLVDEIWASSRFIQDAMAEKSPKPVVHMPMAVEAELHGLYDRADFGLPAEGFLFVYIFDWNSFPARKNPLATVRAFQQAFPDPRAPVGLALKTMGANPSDERWVELMHAIGSDRRIYFLNDVLDREAVLGLVSVCDAVVSLHRSEGFGRTIAEAMLLSKPVIATAYSGNLDFCSGDICAMVPGNLIPVGADEYPFAEGLLWADPDISVAAMHMQRFVHDVSFRANLAHQGQTRIRAVADASVVGRRYLRRLNNLYRTHVRSRGNEMRPQ